MLAVQKGVEGFRMYGRLGGRILFMALAVTMDMWTQIFESLEDIEKVEADAATKFLTEQKLETQKKGEGVDKTDFPADEYAKLPVNVKSALGRGLNPSGALPPWNRQVFRRTCRRSPTPFTMVCGGKFVAMMLLLVLGGGVALEQAMRISPSRLFSACSCRLFRTSFGLKVLVSS